MKLLIVANGYGHKNWQGRLKWVRKYMDIEAELRIIPEIKLKQAPPRSDDNQRGLDENWFNKTILPYADGYDWVHFACTEKQWKENGLDATLGGRELQPRNGIARTYSQQEVGEMYTMNPAWNTGFNKIDEICIAIIHEGGHALYGLADKQASDDVHQRIAERGHFAMWEEVRAITKPKKKSMEPFDTKDPSYLHPELRRRWDKLKKDWKEAYPGKHEPMSVVTYRNNAQQEIEYRQGQSNARGGRSFHNFNPSYAIDFVFARPKPETADPLDFNDVQWTRSPEYEEFGEEAKKLGLVWGGDWTWKNDDIYHLQLPASLSEARRGNLTHMPNIDYSVNIFADEKDEYPGVLSNARSYLERLLANNG